MRQRRILRVILGATMIATAAASAFGQEFQPLQVPGLQGFESTETPGKAAVTARAVPSHASVTPGQTFHLAVDVTIADGWVYYSPDPGPNVLPGRIRVVAPGLSVGRTLWPKDHPKRTELPDADPIVNNVYDKRVVLYVPLTVPDKPNRKTFEITAIVEGQICAKVCVNVEGVVAGASVALGAESAVDPQWQADEAVAGGLAAAMPAEKLPLAREHPDSPQVAVYASAQDWTLWTGLGVALLAGLTLNIMPCVLPVIPLRILSIVQTAGQSRRRFITLGLAFAGGIVLFFAGVAAVNVVLRLVTSEGLNLSEHFQYREFRIAMALIVIAIAANLFGAFNVVVPTRLAAAGEGGKRQGHLGSVGMGVMMAVLATPCSFAFLAAALAWAHAQPLWLGTVVILSIGVGMAAPHALLCAFPKLVDKLPKPGRWMELFKQTMGFALLPVAIWLLSTLGADAYPWWVACFGVVMAFGLWVWGTWVRYDAPRPRKLIIRGAVAVLVAAAGIWMLPPPRENPDALTFEPFDAARIDEARRGGRIVVLKFDAAWCTECKVIDYKVYRTAEIAEQFARHNVLAMKGDVTNRGTPADVYLRTRYGGAPPVTVVYPAGGGRETVFVGGFEKTRLIRALGPPVR